MTPTLLTALVALTHAATAGDIILASDTTSGGTVTFNASNGSNFNPNACGSDLTHGGGTRYFAAIEPTGNLLPNGMSESHLYAYDANCWPVAELTSDANTRHITVRWSPNGVRLAWTAEKFDTVSGSVMERGIYVADVVFGANGQPAGVNNVRLAIPTATPDVLFTWSGDNRRVAYSAQQVSGGQWDIYVADLDLETAVNVTNSPTVNENGASFSVAYDTIAFTKQTVVRGAVRTDIFTMNSSGANVRQVTSKANTASAVNLTPAFSPDGNSLAFSGLPTKMGGQRDIYRIATSGATKAVNLSGATANNLMAPTWR